ncbi:hypothetical protein AVEN_147426-1 [Araneus ventricosus]|uniref:Uncharacterized protein n=1 Tax=Araneus ventricosus TaxID=182803 RepID=A0A4Y2DRR8_ARAVE|nr:hypothetical protein AVEN_147426-1 [Araneus ventricosus]
MKFYLPEHDYSSKIYPEVRFARKYASMFRHVEIICKTVRTHLFGVIWRQLKMFLKAMESSSQLSSIKFIDMKDYLINLDGYEVHEEHYQIIIKIVISIFNTQDSIKTVVFEESSFRIEVCSELLKTIFHSDRNTIRNLILRGSINEAPPFSEVQRSRRNMNILRCHQKCVSIFSELCGRMAYIQSLEIDYTQFFEGIMNGPV